MAENKPKTLEQGDIYFFYRPKVDENDPKGRSDVQRLYMVLHPSDRKHIRLAIIGRKKMPDPHRHGKARMWGFIDMVRNKPEKIVEELKEDAYQTKTRGERHQPAARPFGEGVYRILRHKDHTHLVYALEHPKKPDDVQDAFEVEEDASYIISIRNPEKGSPRNAGLSDEREADFPESLQKKFEGRRFFDADPPHFLDYEGAEFLLVSASENVKEELGIDLDAEHEKQSDADVFEDLHLHRKENPVEPLFHGDWA